MADTSVRTRNARHGFTFESTQEVLQEDFDLSHDTVYLVIRRNKNPELVIEPEGTKTQARRAIHLRQRELIWVERALKKLRSAIIDVYSWNEPAEDKDMHLASCQISVRLFEAILRQHRAAQRGQRFVSGHGEVNDLFGLSDSRV
jgi:hypothetical protein